MSKKVKFIIYIILIATGFSFTAYSYELNEGVYVFSEDIQMQAGDYKLNAGASSLSGIASNAIYTLTGGGIVPLVPELRITFLDNFDDGDISDWTKSSGTNLWHVEGNSYHSSLKSIAYNNGTNYDIGANSGQITSPQINLTGKTGNITLSLWTKWQHESYSWGDYDNMKIEVYDGTTWRRIFYNDCNEGASSSGWHQESFDISSYAQNRITQIRFSFNTVDALYNRYFGWYIDDVQVTHNPTASLVKTSEEIEHIDELSPERKLIPSETAIFSAFPNPARDSVYFPLQLSESGDVNITVYNILGQRVKTINIGEKTAGFYTTSNSAPFWNLTNDEGERLSCGLYFCKIDINIKKGKKISVNSRIIIQR